MSPNFRYAIYLALCTALFSGINNFLTKIAVTAVSDPIVYTFVKNGIVALFLLGIVLLTSRWREITSLTRSDAVKLCAIGVIGGSFPFILYFIGLSMIPALNASFIHKTLFIWVALMAIPFLHERIGKLQFAALALLLGGNLALGFPTFTWSTGELLVLTATFLWAVENIIAKKALQNLSSLLVAGARMILGSLIILAVIAIQGKVSMLGGLSPIQWGWTVLTSALLFGYVLTWYTALKYAPAMLVASLLVPATLITNVLTAIFITHTFPTAQLVSGTLIAIGVLFLISRAQRISPQQASQPSSSYT